MRSGRSALLGLSSRAEAAARFSARRPTVRPASLLWLWGSFSTHNAVNLGRNV
jgi:hypothetical protein